MSMRSASMISEAIRQNKGYLFDHNFQGADPFKIEYLGIYKDDRTGERVIPLFPCGKFPITPIELDLSGRPVITHEKINNEIIDMNEFKNNVFDLGNNQHITLVMKI